MSALELVACACGCGQHFVNRAVGGWAQRYIVGHAPSFHASASDRRTVMVLQPPAAGCPSAPLAEIAAALEAPGADCVTGIVVTGTLVRFEYDS